MPSTSSRRYTTRPGAKVRLTPAQVFDCLPVAALVARDIFCVHGGLSPKLSRPEDVNAIKRPCKILAERNDLLSDLTWSDPHQKIKGAPADVHADLPREADPPHEDTQIWQELDALCHREPARSQNSRMQPIATVLC